jgi:molybdenum cofactor cytidylyltransferase
MKFGPVPIERAEGKILGHNVAGRDGQRVLRKGKRLTPADVATLQSIGYRTVYVAELDVDDVGEDQAARAVAVAVIGQNVQPSFAGGGRMNVVASVRGVVRVDADCLGRMNEIEGITVATIGRHACAGPKQLVATIKIIPFAVPRTALDRVAQVAGATGTPPIRIDALSTRRTALILSGMPGARERVMGEFGPAIRTRLEALGSTLDWVDYVQLEDEDHERQLAEMLSLRIGDGAQAIVLAGETAIMDRHDIAPRAIERAGGIVTCFGAPVDPGNLLLVAFLGDVPILGAPGCARSHKTNVVDWVLPRLLAGDRLTRADITGLGVGGLLDEIMERPAPRESRGLEPQTTQTAPTEEDRWQR